MSSPDSNLFVPPSFAGSGREEGQPKNPTRARRMTQVAPRYHLLFSSLLQPFLHFYHWNQYNRKKAPKCSCPSSECRLPFPAAFPNLRPSQRLSMPFLPSKGRHNCNGI
eukprot:scaffold13825_cov83-Skeletonema_menzelii.AAC.5